MPMLEFIKLVHCFCVKRTIKVNVMVDPYAIDIKSGGWGGWGWGGWVISTNA